MGASASERGRKCPDRIVQEVDVSEMSTVPQVAARLGLSARTVRDLIAAGEIPAIRLGGGHAKVPTRWVDRVTGASEGGL